MEKIQSSQGRAMA